MPFEDYQKIMEQLEEFEDIRDFDAAIVKNEETIPLKEAMKLRKLRNG